MRSSQGLLRTTNRTHVDVAVLAPAQGSSQCIYFNKIGMSSTVKPHSRPFDHCGFWSQAMSPLITWPPSSALRRLQEGFVILCFDLFVTSPRQIPPSLRSPKSLFNFQIFTNIFAACALQRVQRPLEKSCWSIQQAAGLSTSSQEDVLLNLHSSPMFSSLDPIILPGSDG